jgi:GTPase SAR1 family protein
MVRTIEANEAEVSDALRKLQLDFQLVTNPGALMMLPAGVNKASGVWEALRELGVSRHNLVAIGDGENDLALFEFAEQAVAVQNADSLVKRVANRTTQGAYCEGFLELARDLIATDLADAMPRHKVIIGTRENGAAVEITPCKDSLLVHGPDGSGKIALCNRLLEQFLARSYQCCVIDAEAGEMQVPSEMEVFGDAHEVPRITDILSALDQPTASVAVNLAALAAETRPVFTDALLVQLQALHDRLGRPHVVMIRRAHSFLADGAAASSARLSEVTMIYATAEPDRLPARVIEGVTITLNSATQAVTTGGAVVRISGLTAGSPGTESLSESDTATASGY